MKIAFASPEVFPFAKIGGLGDVVGSLPIELSKLGHDIKVFMPKYAIIDSNKYNLKYNAKIGNIPIRVAGKVYNVSVYSTNMPDSDVEIYFIDCPQYYNRIEVYTTDPDEDERFIMFAKSVIESLQHLQWQPDVIHCNDWQTGLIPLYIKDNYCWDKFFDNTATVITIHNIGYQGRFPKETIFKAEVRESLWYENSPIETWNSFNFLKTGLMFADALNTVSPTYAKETMTYELGVGLDGVLHFRKYDYFGILNGVDYTHWNPETDKYIPFHYSKNDIRGKNKNKKYLLDRLNLPHKKDTPIIAIISRLVSQKGFDLIADSINELMNIDAFWIILGFGDKKYEDMVSSINYAYPDKVFTYFGFENELSHLIEAGADILLMPSRYEPCGLNQIYSLKYGTVPVVRKTGGLADTVLDWDEYYNLGQETGTGFSFNDYSSPALISTLQRAVTIFQNKEVWNKIIKNGMSKDFSWNNSLKKYVELYEYAVTKRKIKKIYRFGT